MRLSKHGVHFSIGPIRISTVLRYQGDSKDHLDEWMWMDRKLGVWWKTYRVVGSTRGLPKWLWKDSHSPKIMIGLNLIWANCWIDLAWRPLKLQIDNE
jgi:hypothetical protein